MPDLIKRGEGHRGNVVDFRPRTENIEENREEVGVGKLRTQYDDAGDLRDANLIQIVNEDGKIINGAVVSFERLTTQDLITETNIDLKAKDLLVGEKAANDDIESSTGQEEMEKQINEDVLRGLVVELFREYNNKTGGEILRALRTDFVESKMGNPVTLEPKNTYIIARTGAKTMKDYLNAGISSTLIDGKVVNSTIMTDKKLEGRDLGFSAILNCNGENLKIDFIFGDEEAEATPAKAEEQELPLAA